jgi:aspartate 1-decarboxylase
VRQVTMLHCNNRRAALYPGRVQSGRGTPLGLEDEHVFLTMLKAKLHRATVTGADMHYEGSIGIDRDLLDASGILPHEQVDVLNVSNGARFTTYAIEAPRGSAEIAVNGAAARLVQKGDKVIIVAYCQFPAEEARNYRPTVVVLGEGNEIVSMP